MVQNVTVSWFRFILLTVLADFLARQIPRQAEMK